MGADHKLLDQRSRLARMRAHLDIRTPIDSPRFSDDVVAACRAQVESLMVGVSPRTGEDVLTRLAHSLHVHFEEVHAEPDLARLEQKYLHEKREIGFGQLAMQFNDPQVDALLFERERATADAPDKWVAVLNLRDTASRGYWSRSHELTHRIAEPPQQNLRFYRHQNDRENPLESLIDKVASEIAFYQPLFSPIVGSLSASPLTWELIDQVRALHASSSSRLATAHATLRLWKRPAYLLAAQIAGRKGRPGVDRALRVAIRGFSPDANNELFIIPNMRVPASSPISHTHQTGEQISAYEQLGQWHTSDGTRLNDIKVLTSAFRYRETVFALLSV
jgi:hypothetical protein